MPQQRPRWLLPRRMSMGRDRNGRYHGSRKGSGSNADLAVGAMAGKHYDAILEEQLAMNRQTWAALQRHGLTEDRQIRLDFFYNAPNREAADRLCAVLQEQTDYDVKVETAGSFFRRYWRVEGRTQDTAVSPAILDQWVTWM